MTIGAMGGQDDHELEDLRQRFMRLERLPENEAVALRIESGPIDLNMNCLPMSGQK